MVEKALRKPSILPPSFGEWYKGSAGLSDFPDAIQRRQT